MTRLVRPRAYRLPAPVAFSADGDDGMVLRRGIIWRCGDYPDKNFSMNKEELAEAARHFKPVGLDLDHRPSILDQELGELRAVELTPDGTGLIGTLAVPSWLNKVFDKGEFKRRVSAAWHPTTKRLMKLGLVLNQRVPDAVLMSAFSAARAECDCHAQPATGPKEAPAMTPKKEAMRAYIDSLADDADLDDAQASSILFPDAGEGEGDVDAAEAPPAEFADPRVEALQREVADLKARNAAAELVAFAADASSFLDSPEARRRVSPAERARLEQQLVQAALDDRDAGRSRIVTFGADGKPAAQTRRDSLKASILGRPASPLYAEMVRAEPLPGHRVLDPAGAGAGGGAAEFSGDLDPDVLAARRINARHLGRDRIPQNGHAGR